MKFGILILFFLASFSCFGQKSKLIKWPEMEKMLTDPSDSLTIINFWATWCKPCVAEIPAFEAALKKYKNKPVRIWLVSIDFEELKTSKLDPFIVKHQLKSKVYLLDETDYNRWINKIDESWSGAIPVTLIVNNFKKIRKFVPSELNAEQLHELIRINL